MAGVSPASQWVAADTAAATVLLQATRLPLQLRAINYNDFALVGSVSGVFHKASAHRIVAHIVPFFTVTFVGSQNVIKESGLPKRRPLWRQACRLRFFQQRHRHRAL